MAWNRYEILRRHYRQEISEWDWELVKKQALNNVYEDPYNDSQKIGACWLGTVLGLMPSGKIYMPWTTNQTSADETKDECFYDVLEEVAEEHGMFIDNCDDGDSLFACIGIDSEEEGNDE